jgi:hypothetical protein
MSTQLPTALGLGIRELAQALVLVMSTAAAAALAAVAARRGRWRLLRPRRGTVSAGPWTPAEQGVRVLLDGGPARFRAGPSTIVVQNGGGLVIGLAGSGRPPAAGEVVVARGQTLRVAAAGLGEPEEFLASGRAVWLCVGRARASGPGQAGAPQPAQRDGRRPG